MAIRAKIHRWHYALKIAAVIVIPISFLMARDHLKTDSSRRGDSRLPSISVRVACPKNIGELPLHNHVVLIGNDYILKTLVIIGELIIKKSQF
jgi:hypothetical protein